MDDRLAISPRMLKMARVTAYVDESLRLDAPGVYVLAAVLVPDARATAVRAALRDQLRPGQRRLHWRDEHSVRRRELAAAVAALRLDAVAVTTTPVAPKASERARRLCLTRLLWECDRRGALDLVIESRRHRDRNDREVFAQARRARWVTRDIGYAFQSPADEPLLWVPDAVAGAVATAASGADATYLEILKRTVTLVAVP